MPDVSNQRPSQQYITSHLSRQVVNRRNSQRHAAIERALTAIGYYVKPNVVTYPPGRAAVLPHVIVSMN